MRELIVRKPTDQEFEKKIEVPYGLRHFQFHEDQLITLGTNSEFQTLTEVRKVAFILYTRFRYMLSISWWNN